MKKRPKPPVLVSGGAVRGLGPVPVGLRKPPPRHRPRKPSRVQPGGPVIGLGAPAKKKPVRRKLALGEAVACCVAEALAASLRLAGHPVSDRDVLALYEMTAGNWDEGATIKETLRAAAEHGLAGWRPAGITEVREPGAPRSRSRGEQEVELGALQLGELNSPGTAAVALLDGDEISLLAGLDGYDGDGGAVAGAVLAGIAVRGCLPCHGSSVILGLEELHERDGIWVHPVPGLDFDQSLAIVEGRPVSIQRERNPVGVLPDGQFRLGHVLILGLDLPEGPHAICDDGAAWWSWGWPCDPASFPDAVIREAWQVTWP